MTAVDEATTSKLETTSTLEATAATVNATVLVTILTILSYALPRSPLSQATVVVGTVVVLGAVAAGAVWTGSSLAPRVAITLGAGVLVTMVVGAASGFVFPQVGVAAPLSRAPVSIVLCVLLAACAAYAARQRTDPVRACFDGARSWHWLWSLAACAPPLLALWGVSRSNAMGSSVPSVAAGIVALVLVATAIVLPEAAWCPPRILMLMSALVTAAWQTPLRGGWLLGGDLTHEYYIASLAVRQGQFPLVHYVDAYGGMLSLSVWPAVLHDASGLSLRTILALLPPLILACCLLATWGTVRERVGPRTAAAICAVFVVGAPDLVSVLPSITRQCYALFYLALLVYAVASSRLRTRDARLLAIGAGTGVALCHYSTAFIAAGAVVAGWLVTAAVRTPPAQRVLTLRVATAIAAVTVLWDLGLARAGANVSQVVTAASAGAAGAAVRRAAGMRPAGRLSRPGAPAHVQLAATRAVAAVHAGPAVNGLAAAALAVAGLAALAVLVWAVVVAFREPSRRRRAGVAGILSLVALAAVGVLGLRSTSRGRSLLARGGHEVTSLFRADNPSTHVTAALLRARDLQVLATQDYWMQIDPRARGVRLVDDSALVAHGVRFVAPFLAAVQALAGKAIVLGAVVSVVVCLVACTRNSKVAGVAGIGLFGVAISALWRSSATVGKFFSSTRIQAETYLLFAATFAVMVMALHDLAQGRTKRAGDARWRWAGWAAVGFVAAVVMAGSMGMVNLVTKGAPLDAAFSTRGQQIQTATSPSDLLAARWLIANRPNGLVQSDFSSQGTLNTVGFANRLRYVPSVDPTLTDVRSWVFASRTNVVLGRAFGGSTSYQSIFRFPLGFYTSTRPVLFTSTGAVVFGTTAPGH